MCSLCQEVTKEIVHLTLYVNGSEGCWVCLNCRMILERKANRCVSFFISGRNGQLLKKGFLEIEFRGR